MTKDDDFREKILWKYDAIRKKKKCWTMSAYFLTYKSLIDWILSERGQDQNKPKKYNY